MKIDPDVWLAEILGYDVFRVSVDETSADGGPNTLRDVSLLRAHQQRAQRSFYYAKFPTERVDLVNTLTSAGFGVVDVLVVFGLPCSQVGQRATAAQPQASEVVITDYVPPSQHEAVLDIAGSAFLYSRFHLDPQIAPKAANAIKRAWIGNYIAGSRGERLMVALHEKEPVGFIAVLSAELNGQKCRVIDLIAVDTGHQGRGIGKALVSSFAQWHAKECDLLRVGTQAANVASMRLYETCGFSVDETSYVMHAHTQNGKVLR